MRYLLALLFPPLAILSCGKIIQFVINLVLWMISMFGLYYLGLIVIFPFCFLSLAIVVHALSVVSDFQDEKTKVLVEQQRQGLQNLREENI